MSVEEEMEDLEEVNEDGEESVQNEDGALAQGENESML